MKSLARILIYFVWLLALDCFASSDILNAYNPFDKMTSVNIDITIGESIDAAKDQGERLFLNNNDRSNAFKKSLKNAILKRLIPLGISGTEVQDKSYIMVAIYGHKVKAGACGIDYVFYYDLAIHGEDQEVMDGPGREWGKIGEASDKQLEAVLIESIVRSMEDSLYGLELKKNRNLRNNHHPNRSTLFSPFSPFSPF